MNSSRFVSRTGALPLLLAVAALACAAAPAPASAAGIGDCGQPVGQVFLPWADPGWYFQAPDGSFENSAAGWSLAGDAEVVADNEPFFVGGPGTHALQLDGGASATSPPICIGLVDPTVRFFATGSGLLLVTAHVTVAGATVDAPVGVVTASDSWQPTSPLPLLANLLAPLPVDGTGEVTLTFSPVLGSVRIDDVWVDPFMTS